MNKEIIKNIIENRIFMSPMAGVTDIPFRTIVQKYGCRFCFTEMIDANGIFYNNLKTVRMLDIGPDKATLAVQIAGAEIDKIIYAGKVCEEKGFKLIELNAACPVRKIVSHHKGAALLRDLSKFRKIIASLIKSVSIPVTVKIRSGWDNSNINCIQTAKISEQEGISAVCIHPRTKAQLYSGIPDHELVLKIKEAVKIPVFASGNIFHPTDVSDLFAKTHCDAIAIARGALGRPWIFQEIYDYLTGIKADPIQLNKVIKDHFALAFEYYGDKKAIQRMHSNMQWYLKGMKNRHNIMLEYRKIGNLEEFYRFIDKVLAV